MSKESKQPSQELAAIQKLISAGDLPAAMKRLGTLPEVVRTSPDALYMAAVCCRHMGDFQRSREFLRLLLNETPLYSRGHQELGHLLKQQGLARDALASYGRACRINPALEASWRSQLEILEDAAGPGAEQRRQHLQAQLQ